MIICKDNDIAIARYNPDFKGGEFDPFRKESCTNAFALIPSRWTEAANAIGITSKSGRYGGTYAHSDIAFERNCRKGESQCGAGDS